MTDRAILKKLYSKIISYPLGSVDTEYIDQALEKLRTHYREKIKRVGIEDIIRELDLCVELAPSDIYAIAQAVLKAIDKEMR